MKKYLAVILLIIFVLSATVSALPVIDGITYTRGESWLLWKWNQTPSSTPGQFLYTSVDGDIKGILNLSDTPDSLVPREYYLTGLEPNEKHSFKVYILDNTTSPPTVVTSAALAATTSQPSSYTTMIFLLALVLLGASFVISLTRNVIIPLILASTSGVLNIYISVAVWEVNSSFSTVAVIAAIIALAIILWILYQTWEDNRIWRD
jgi:hypothetical protein